MYVGEDIREQSKSEGFLINVRNLIMTLSVSRVAERFSICCLFCFLLNVYRLLHLLNSTGHLAMEITQCMMKDLLLYCALPQPHCVCFKGQKRESKKC